MAAGAALRVSCPRPLLLEKGLLTFQGPAESCGPFSLEESTNADRNSASVSWARCTGLGLRLRIPPCSPTGKGGTEDAGGPRSGTEGPSQAGGDSWRGPHSPGSIFQLLTDGHSHGHSGKESGCFRSKE